MVESPADNGHTIFKNSCTDLAYQVHYNRQLLMKLLAHFIAIDAEFWSAPTNDVAEKFIENLNSHVAKVHFTVDEIKDITKIVEEAKKFI